MGGAVSFMRDYQITTYDKGRPMITQSCGTAQQLMNDLKDVWHKDKIDVEIGPEVKSIRSNL